LSVFFYVEARCTAVFIATGEGADTGACAVGVVEDFAGVGRVTGDGRPVFGRSDEELLVWIENRPVRWR